MTPVVMAGSRRRCRVPQCPRNYNSWGLCSTHRERLRRTGTTDDPKPPTLEDRFWVKVDKRGPDECWPWTGMTDENGYGRLAKTGSPQKIRAHRVSARIAGMDIEGWDVLHSCDNPPCVNPAHLRPGTPADNAADKARRGRSMRGERHDRAKLTAQAVIEIRRRRATGETFRSLGTAYGVAHTTIIKVVRGANWRHIEDGQAANHADRCDTIPSDSTRGTV